MVTPSVIVQEFSKMKKEKYRNHKTQNNFQNNFVREENPGVIVETPCRQREESKLRDFSTDF